MMFLSVLTFSTFTLAIYGYRSYRNTQVIDLIADGYENGGGVLYFPINPNWPNADDPELFPQGEPGANWGLRQATLKIKKYNNEYELIMRGYGFPTNIPIDSYFAIGPPGTSNHPIYTSQVAELTSPIASSTASFHSGRDGNCKRMDPNGIKVKSNGDWELKVKLDYDPRLPSSVPMVNAVSRITQAEFENTYDDGNIKITNLKQNVYRSGNRIQGIASEYIRMFNEDGTQMLDENGNQMIARHPAAMNEIVIRVNIDQTTSGMAERLFQPGNADDMFERAIIYVPLRLCFRSGAGACQGPFADQNEFVAKHKKRHK